MVALLLDSVHLQTVFPAL